MSVGWVVFGVLCVILFIFAYAFGKVIHDSIKMFWYDYDKEYEDEDEEKEVK